MKDINVGLGEYVISRDPDDVLVAYGLGSCIGVVMIDPTIKLYSLLHAVLPRLTDGSSGEVNPHKYVENGIYSLIELMRKEGANPSRLIVRIVGGANMLLTSSLTQAFDIGTRNIEAARSTLEQLRLPITAAEVGGHTGRTLRVYVAENRVTVRVVGQKEHEI